MIAIGNVFADNPGTYFLFAEQFERFVRVRSRSTNRRRQQNCQRKDLRRSAAHDRLRRKRAAPPANCASLRKVSRTQPLAFVAVLIVQLRGVVPADCLHIDVDIARGRGTIVHVISVLVHVEH